MLSGSARVQQAALRSVEAQLQALRDEFPDLRSQVQANLQRTLGQGFGWGFLDEDEKEDDADDAIAGA